MRLPALPTAHHMAPGANEEMPDGSVRASPVDHRLYEVPQMIAAMTAAYNQAIEDAAKVCEERWSDYECGATAIRALKQEQPK